MRKENEFIGLYEPLDPNDPDSLTLWGYSARQWRQGGRFNPKARVPSYYQKSIKKGTTAYRTTPQRREVYIDEWITEPSLSVSTMAGIGELARSMCVRGATYEQYAAAMSRPDMPGSAFWIWASSRLGWEEDDRAFYSQFQFKGHGVTPAPILLKPPVGDQCYPIHPDLQLICPVSGEVFSASLYYDPMGHRCTVMKWNEKSLTRICKVIESHPGIGVNQAKRATLHIIKSPQTRQSYIEEAIARGYINQEHNGNGRKSPLSITSAGLDFIHNSVAPNLDLSSGGLGSL